MRVGNQLEDGHLVDGGSKKRAVSWKTSAAARDASKRTGSEGAGPN